MSADTIAPPHPATASSAAAVLPALGRALAADSALALVRRWAALAGADLACPLPRIGFS